jgi:hypothetical protein
MARRNRALHRQPALQILPTSLAEAKVCDRRKLLNERQLRLRCSHNFA